jgi:hypothetical protein
MSTVISTHPVQESGISIMCASKTTVVGCDLLLDSSMSAESFAFYTRIDCSVRSKNDSGFGTTTNQVGDIRTTCYCWLQSALVDIYASRTTCAQDRQPCSCVDTSMLANHAVGFSYAYIDASTKRVVIVNSDFYEPEV